MAESNREPPLCPCGFWGSTQTSGLCSKCYKEMLKRKECTPGSSPSSSSSPAQPSNPVKVVVTPASPNHPLPHNSLSVASHSPTKWPKSTKQTDDHETRNSDSPGILENNTRMSSNGLTTQDSEIFEAEESDGSGVDPKGSREQMTSEALAIEEKSTDTTSTDEDCLTPERSVQKNKRKCFKCRCRLDLAACELGRCKCDYIFCELHRLPEQHDCTYDHKGMGRQEARQKMISPKKQVGNSLKRLDSDS